MDTTQNAVVLGIRKARLTPSDEAALVAAVEAYGKQQWKKGYDEGIAVANSDRP